MVLASVVLVYLVYWLYLRRNGLAEFSAQSEALQLVGEALMEEKVGQQKKYAVALAGIEGPDMCSFWTCKAVRSKCRGVSLVVRDLKETDREKIPLILQDISRKAWVVDASMSTR